MSIPELSQQMQVIEVEPGYNYTVTVVAYSNQFPGKASVMMANTG